MKNYRMKRFLLIIKLALLNPIRFFQSLNFYRAKFFHPGILIVSNEIIQTFEKNGWNIFQNHKWHLGITYVPHPVKTNPIYLFEKTFPEADNIGVIVSIHPYQKDFVVINCAEHRTSGPSITVELAHTLEGAIAIAQSSCQFWDERLNSNPKNSK
jgi:hypothetical protein